LHYDKRLAIEPLTLPQLCRFLSGGIVAKINQPKSVGQPFGIVEVKKRDCSTTAGSNVLDKTTIEAKMAFPSLLTWMKEEDDFL